MTLSETIAAKKDFISRNVDTLDTLRRMYPECPERDLEEALWSAAGLLENGSKIATVSVAKLLLS